jgi:REP element-mobilizing transposase RayT
MLITVKYKAKYEFGAFYHVYNRTSTRQIMFREKSNNYFFLEKFHQYLGNYVAILSWCLIPNHFHFLIRIEDAKDMPYLTCEKDINTIITR